MAEGHLRIYLFLTSFYRTIILLDSLLLGIRSGLPFRDHIEPMVLLFEYFSKVESQVQDGC